MDLAAHKVFEEVVTVEPAAPLPQLRNPWPDNRSGGSDGHCTRGRQVRAPQKIVSGKNQIHLLVSRLPPQVPPPENGNGAHASEGN
jgi:hypothetical protein